MKMRKLYGIGIGPGDPELLTLKACRILKEVDMIVAPRSRLDKRSLALFVVEKVLDMKGKIVIEPVFPMTKEEDKLSLYWNKARKEVLEKASSCEVVAFITLGDPSLYSTFYKFLDIFKDEVEEVEVIPGITSFSACSAIAKVPIAEGDEIFSIIPDIGEGNAVRIMHDSDSLIFLKPKDIIRIREIIGDREAILGVKLGLEGQKMIFGKLSEMEKPIYLSTLIVKKGEE